MICVVSPLPITFSEVRVLSLLEIIQQLGAQHIGIELSAQAHPEFAVASMPNEMDIQVSVNIISMFNCHQWVCLTVLCWAVLMMVGLCIGIAANTERKIV
jgi:hypothetical protein